MESQEYGHAIFEPYSYIPLTVASLKNNQDNAMENQDKNVEIHLLFSSEKFINMQKD